MEEKSLNLNPTIKTSTFQLNVVSKVFLMDLVLLGLKKYLLAEMCMIFSVDYNSIDKSDIINSHKYLILTIV